MNEIKTKKETEEQELINITAIYLDNKHLSKLSLKSFINYENILLLTLRNNILTNMT